MEEIEKANLFFNRTQCNVTHGWHRQTQVNGFLVRIMWVKVARSNNNPVVPVSYYLETVSTLKLCLTLLQTDCGAESNITAGSNAISQMILVRINMARRHQTRE